MRTFEMALEGGSSDRPRTCFSKPLMNVDLSENPPPLVPMLDKRSESEPEHDAFGAEGGDPEHARRHRSELSPGPTSVQVDERCETATDMRIAAGVLPCASVLDHDAAQPLM
jgi:hypothetical protein